MEQGHQFDKGGDFDPQQSEGQFFFGGREVWIEFTRGSRAGFFPPLEKAGVCFVDLLGLFAKPPQPERRKRWIVASEGVLPGEEFIGDDTQRHHIGRWGGWLKLIWMRGLRWHFAIKGRLKERTLLVFIDGVVRG